VIRFHGFGNETELTEPDEFYRVEQEQYSLGSEVVMPLGRGEGASLAVGPVVKYSETGPNSGRLIAFLRPYGAGSFGQVGVRTEAQVDTRDRPVASTKGVLLLAGGAYYPGVWDVERGFGEVHGSAATYLTASRTTLALRASGKRVLGDYPFHEAAFLGDASTVRLGREQRYAGDAAVWGNAELRVFLARMTLVLPADVGVFGLGDVGRVYVQGERSERWHNAVGGGIWIAFLQRANAVTFAVARGEERTGVYVQAGFQF
jgi:hypothetical protein